MTSRFRTIAVLLFSTIACTHNCLAGHPTPTPVPNGFNYQGHLEMEGQPFTGNAEIIFHIYGFGINPIFTEIFPEVQITDGLLELYVSLAAFDFFGEELTAEIEIRTPPGSGPFTTLSPRQPIRSVPYAMRATTAEITTTSKSLNLPVTLEPFQITEHASLIINQPEPTGGAALRLTRSSESNQFESLVARVQEIETTATPVGLLSTAPFYPIVGLITENASPNGAALLGQVNPGAPTSQVGLHAVNHIGSTQALLATHNHDAIMDGDVRVFGDITKSYSPNAFDLVAPIAYGTIDFNGTILSGTPNFSCVWNNVNLRYEIQIDNENYFYADYVTVATPVNDNDRTSAGSASNRLIIEIESIASGAQEQGRFHFITYKPNGAAAIQCQHRPPLTPLTTPYNDAELNQQPAHPKPRTPIATDSTTRSHIKQD